MKSGQEKTNAQYDARIVWQWLDKTYLSTYANTAHITVGNVLTLATSAVSLPLEWHERADGLHFERRFATPLIRAVARDANKTSDSDDKESGSEGGGSIGEEGDDEKAPSPKPGTKQSDSSEEIDDDLEDEHKSDKGEEGDKSDENSGTDSSEQSGSGSSEEDSDSFSSETESEYNPNSDSGSSDDGRRKVPTTRRPVRRATKKSSELTHYTSAEDMTPKKRRIRRVLAVSPTPARSSSSHDSPITTPLRPPYGSAIERSNPYEGKSDRAYDPQDEEEDSDGPPLSRYPRKFPKRAADRASRHGEPTAVHDIPTASLSSCSSSKVAGADESPRAVEDSPERRVDEELEYKEEGDEKEERDDAPLPPRRNPRRTAREEDEQEQNEEEVKENFVEASPPRRNPRRTARRSVNYADTLKGPEEEEEDSSSSSDKAPDSPRSHDRFRIFDERRDGPDDSNFDSDSDSDDKELLQHVEPVPIDPISDAVRRRYDDLFDYDRDFGQGETAEDRLRKGGLLRKLECGGEDEGPRKRRRRRRA